MALTSWGDILNKPDGVDEVPEIALTVQQLSASVLSISEDVGEIAGDVQEIALEVSQLSASTLPYSISQSTKNKIDEVDGKFAFELIGTKAFNTNQFLNSRYNEFYIEANIENDLSVVIPVTLTRQQLNVNDKIFRTGYYVNSTNYGTIAIMVTISGNDMYIKLSYFNIGGTSYDNAIMTVYGR